MTDTLLPLVAHRGYMQHYPENSWRGLEAALKAGACWLEFDVQMCADGRFVLLHDDNFERTAGIAQSVFALNSVDIDVSVHEPARFAQQYAPTPVSLLDDVLSRLDNYPDVSAMVEIKQESIDHWGLDTVMPPLISLLQAHRSQCHLISFAAGAIQWCSEHSDLGTGWVLHAFDPEHRQIAQRLQPGFLICNYRKIPVHDALWEGPWRWMLYDITDPAMAIEWGRRGAALIETADIGTMLADVSLAPGACKHGL